MEGSSWNRLSLVSSEFRNCGSYCNELCYYVLDNPIMEDAVYDQLYRDCNNWKPSIQN